MHRKATGAGASSTDQLFLSEHDPQTLVQPELDFWRILSAGFGRRRFLNGTTLSNPRSVNICKFVVTNQKTTSAFPFKRT